MIVTSDRPWRRHYRRAWRWVVGAVVLAAIITAGRWGWHFGASAVARAPALPAEVVQVEHAAYLESSSAFPGMWGNRSLSVSPVDRSVTDTASQFADGEGHYRSAAMRRWHTVKGISPELFRHTTAVDQSIAARLTFDDQFLDFHLDPVMASAPSRVAWVGLLFRARLADGSRVWVLEVSQPVLPADASSTDLYRYRQILVFDQNLGKVLQRSGWYESLWKTTAGPTVRVFITWFGITLLVAAVPIFLAIRRASVVRRRFLARRCVVCDYNFAGHGDGLLTCPECGQVQWPVDVAGIGA